jgi:predicted NAD/FAD-binding protein
MLQFPVATMIRFCHNHGLLQVNNRPQWYTVRGGARHYVEAIVSRLTDARLNSPVSLIERHANGVWVHTPNGPEQFDEVVIATHTDQALRMLEHPSAMEDNVLGQISYQPNIAVLHTDVTALPKRRAAWASWNYERATIDSQENQRVCLHYWLNQLQPLPTQVPVIETLNPIRPIDPAKVLATFEYSHPVFDLKAMKAQALVPLLQGQNRTWYAGAWTGYGFHEDGLKSGLAVVKGLMNKLGQEASLKEAA